MPRAINKLSAQRVKTEKKPGRYADGGGLYLQVSGAGTKSWLFRFSLNKKAREMGLGGVHTVSLQEARLEAEACRKFLRDGIDPIERREQERAQRQADTREVRTFKHCAERYIKAHSESWKNDKHAAQWESTLKTYVYPIMGDLSVQDISTSEVMDVLEPIWTTKTETANRVRGRMEAIVDWATARKYREGENPARWKGHLDKLLPAKSRVKKVRHHPALPYQEAGAFMAELRDLSGISARALEFTILTATRTSETIGAEWDEFDLDAKVWTIPADRMKARKEQRVPLPDRAVKIVREMHDIKTSEYVFPGARKKRPLSTMSLLQTIRRMGHENVTTHGFRSTFRDWAAECTNYPREVAEMALAHTVEDKVEGAYRRGDLFEKRRRMMKDWSKFCATPAKDQKDNIIPLNKTPGKGKAS